MELIKDPILQLPTEGFRICDILNKMDTYIRDTYDIEITQDLEFEKIRSFVEYFFDYSDDPIRDSDNIDYLVILILSSKGTLWINNLNLELLNLDIKEEFVTIQDLELKVNINEMVTPDPGRGISIMEDNFSFLYYYRKIIFIIDSIVRALELNCDAKILYSISSMNFLRFSAW